MRNEKILLEARFDAKLPTYWMMQTLGVLLVTVIGIPAIPVWLIIGWGIHKKQYDAQSCTLTERSLNIKHGLIFRVEKNIPLDKIQDVGMKEGPLLRKLGLASLSIETAGQSNPQGGSDAALVGVIDSPAFRDAILDQRELIVSSSLPTAARRAEDTSDEGVLTEIRDSVHRIEELLRSATN
ncbi:MAG: hypothetical protein CMJ89_12435 [Planctomycetes bacterium]|jgi:putative membrane protein|nr:hypothetical protein [Planctomycetota bacterium]